MSRNIFREACLIQLSVSCWQGAKTLAASILEERFDKSEWLSGRKYLVSPESLLPMKAVVSRARGLLEKRALPFPVKGLTLVPKEMISAIDASLVDIKAEFEAAVAEFVAKYEDERSAASENLGELFCETDYPVDIIGRFRFEWRFLTLDVPGKSSVLPPAVYEREKKKFCAMMQETQDLAVTALREEFAGLVRHMLDRLSGEEDGKPKQFRMSLLSNFNRFLSTFDERNLFQDEGLSELVKQAKGLISNVSPEKLRESAKLRNLISNRMAEIKTAVDKALEDLPRRKIRIAA